MRKNGKKISIVLALILCAAVAVSVLAEGLGPVCTLYQSAERLLFDTDNASVQLHAEFCYNGMPFKKMDASYVQDGSDSLMDLKLLTPRAYEDDLESGYTVVASDGLAYSIEPVLNPWVYSVSPYVSSNSILSSTMLRRTILWLGGAVAEAAEGAFAGKIAAVQTANGTDYHVTVSEGDAPVLVNAAGTLLAQMAAERYFYAGYSWNDRILYPENTDYFDYFYDDYDAVFALYYQKLFDKPLPGEFYGMMYGENQQVADEAFDEYMQVSEKINQEIAEELEKQYTSGVAVIRANGEIDYYASRTEYILDNDMQQVCYADYSAAYKAYYQQKTGQLLTDSDIDAVYMSDNEALWDAYVTIGEEMEQAYMDQLRSYPGAVVLYVDSDMKAWPVYDYNAYMLAAGGWNDFTVKDYILYRMDKLELGDTDFTVTLDDQGRVTAAAGTVRIIVQDQDGVGGDLDIVFDLTVSDYGRSDVAPFDPRQYGVVSWEEFSRDPEKYQLSTPEPEQTESVLPQTLMFDGVSYQLILEQSE